MERDFKNLNKFQEIQINSILDENKKKEQKLKPIWDSLKNYFIDEIWDFNGYQIAKITNKKNEVYYASFIGYKSLNEFTYTFDQAILTCLTHKYDNGKTMASFYISNMLNMPNRPESN